MKKKNTFLTVALLLAVVVLGVGYAAANGPLVINGSATAKGSQLNVEFTDAKAADGDVNVKSAEVTTDTAVATMEVELDEINETATAEFTITNNSKEGIGANIDENDITVTYGDTDADVSEYFTVTYDLAETDLPSGESTTLTVTVRLDKVGLNDVTEKFKVSVNTIEAYEED